MGLPYCTRRLLSLMPATALTLSAAMGVTPGCISGWLKSLRKHRLCFIGWYEQSSGGRRRAVHLAGRGQDAHRGSTRPALAEPEPPPALPPVGNSHPFSQLFNL